MKKSILSKKTALFWGVILLCFTVYGQNSGQKHMLWKVSKAGLVQGYLVGSMHFAEPQLYPLDSIFLRVMKKSSPIVFELNIDSMQAAKITLIRKLAFYPPDENLQENLPDSTYQKVSQRLKAFGFPMTNRIKPWFAAMTLMAFNAKKAGMTQQGIDMYFFAKAKQQKKPIVGLETAEQQLKIFSGLSKEKQIKLLQSVLENNQQAKDEKFYDKLTRYWKAGKAKATHKMLHTQFGELKKKSKKLYAKLITNRNQNWRVALEKMYKSGKKPMVIVGLGHLIGKNSVIALLKKDGFTVTQL